MKLVLSRQVTETSVWPGATISPELGARLVWFAYIHLFASAKLPFWKVQLCNPSLSFPLAKSQAGEVEGKDGYVQDAQQRGAIGVHWPSHTFTAIHAFARMDGVHYIHSEELRGHEWEPCNRKLYVGTPLPLQTRKILA
eukprot:1157337-Pelagomonas_calceolata.AAC.2